MGTKHPWLKLKDVFVPMVWFLTEALQIVWVFFSKSRSLFEFEELGVKITHSTSKCFCGCSVSLASFNLKSVEVKDVHKATKVFQKFAMIKFSFGKDPFLTFKFDFWDF